MKLDIFGEPIIVPPKCKNCGREKGSHHGITSGCPRGRGNFPTFHQNQFYEPRETKS